MSSSAVTAQVTQPRVEPLTKLLGARIHDVDCRDVSAPLWEQILRLFHEHHLLVFPEQDLAPEHLIAFMERFGELDVHPQELSARTTLPLPGHPKIELMANKPGSTGPKAPHWHTDVTFRDEPVAVTSLYGVETPAACADTIWTNLRAVFDDCSPGLKQTLRGLNAVHATSFVTASKGQGSPADYDPTQESDPRKKDLRAQYRAEVVHPVVHAHEAGFETLYVNPLFVSRFEGWTPEESATLLGCLYDQASAPQYQYRHRWSQRDLVVWDNRCMMHLGVNDYGEEDRRVLHRTTGCPFTVHPSR